MCSAERRFTYFKVPAFLSFLTWTRRVSELILFNLLIGLFIFDLEGGEKKFLIFEVKEVVLDSKGY
jgi:hypothetical protein